MTTSKGFFADQVEALERRLITEALEKAHGNVSEASRLLEMPRRTLWHKLNGYGIDYEGIREEVADQPVASSEAKARKKRK